MKFRSKFEQTISKSLPKGTTYESVKITYQRKPSNYKPDFILPNGIILEIKGLFKSSDRAKHLLIKEQHPELDIRFVFMQDNYLSKKSKTKYSDWAKKHGFQYCFSKVPKEWLK